jgi:competence protein ComEA
MQQPMPSLPSAPAKPDRFAAWPRSLQLATVSLASIFFTLLIVRGQALWSSSNRPLEIESDLPLQFRIDLNEADRATLLQIPGVGEAMAERILSYRQANGPFRNLQQLLEIRGMGAATLERLRPWVEVKGDSSSAITRVSSTKKQQAPLKVAGPSKSDAATPAKPGASVSKVDGLTGPIPINTASLEDLQKLPRVGLKRAQQIIDERNKSPFRTLDDLRRVSGIGAKTLETLRPWIMLNEPEHKDAPVNSEKARSGD